MYALDTNILIYYVGGDQGVVTVLDEWRRDHEVFLISAIVHAEVLALPRLTTADVTRIEGLLATMQSVSVDTAVARLAAEFRRRYRLKLPDAIIAATAFLRNAPLVTRNAGDFQRVKEIELVAI